MIVLKYIITFIFSIISTSFLSIIMTVLRCGIPLCKQYKEDADIPEIDKKASNKLQKKYYLSLVIDTIIIVILSSIVYFLMSECLIFYVIFIVFLFIISINKTGMTENNIMEFTNSIKANRDENYNQKIEDNINNDKYVRLSKILMKALNTTDINEAIEKSSSFYKEQGIEIDKINFSSQNPYIILSEIAMFALGVDDIDEATIQTINFYKEQGIDVDI